MARKIPNSNKAKKVKLQDERVRKALAKMPTLHPLDQEALEAKSSNTVSALSLPPSLTASRGSGAQKHRTIEEEVRDTRKEKTLRMESRFLRLPLDLLQHHRRVSATTILERPIPDELGVLNVEELQPKGLEGLTCPKRPKWSYNSTKAMVEKNEEGLFTQWLNETDAILSKYAQSLPTTPAPSFFERNLNVWRQLWRVTETSSILLILVDVRFPLIHYPPSLENYVKTLKPRKKVILVLTKTDLVPKWLARAWQIYFEEQDSETPVVLMESYRETERNVLTQGTQPRFVPAAPTSFRLSLLAALRKAHTDLLTPPPIVADFPDRLKHWQPKVRREVNWEVIENEEATAGGGRAHNDGIIVEKVEKKVRRNKTKDIYVERKKKPVAGEEVVEEEEEVVVEPEPEIAREDLVGDDAYPFLTIGLIGQPNVGKSSLLNALLGRKVAKASKTPGKTKTLQTIFWSDSIRLCDCPGLVVPSFSGMERQVVAGVIPIQNVEPVLFYLAQRIPFEKILKLKLPVDSDILSDGIERWTADDLLATYAISQGFLTAKAGRPDLYRAGSYLLRQLHSSHLPWGFRPPFKGDPTAQDQQGIYFPNFVAKASTKAELDREKAMAHKEEEVSSGEDDEDDEEGGNNEDEDESSSEEEESDDDGETAAIQAVKSAFAGLEIEGGEDDSEEAEEEG